ncbi:MAG: hypothetical protein ABW061_17855 [Polyangiaceae bacterium]
MGLWEKKRLVLAIGVVGLACACGEAAQSSAPQSEAGSSGAALSGTAGLAGERAVSSGGGGMGNANAGRASTAAAGANPVAVGGAAAAGANGAAGAPNPCPAAIDPGDQTSDHASPYTLGTDKRACLSANQIEFGGTTINDVDYYRFTTPNDGYGGYVVVRLSDIVMQHVVDNPYAFELKVGLYAGSDQGMLDTFNNEGTPVTAPDFGFWFAAAPNTDYLVQVQFDVPSQIDATEYTLRADYTPAPDPFEPNDGYSPQPPRLPIGEPVQAYLLAGYASATKPSSADFYALTLAAGAATISISDVPSDIRMEASLVPNFTTPAMDPVGNTADMPGQPLTLQITVPAGGADFYLVLGSADHAQEPLGWGTTPADYARHPYTIEVTQ